MHKGRDRAHLKSQSREEGAGQRCTEQQEKAARRVSGDQRPSARTGNRQAQPRHRGAKRRAHIDDSDALKSQVPVHDGQRNHRGGNQGLLRRDGEEICRHSRHAIDGCNPWRGKQRNRGDRERRPDDKPEQRVELEAGDRRCLHECIGCAQSVERFDNHADGHDKRRDAHLFLGEKQQHDENCRKVDDLGNDSCATKPIEAATQMLAMAIHIVRLATRLR